MWWAALVHVSAGPPWAGTGTVVSALGQVCCVVLHSSGILSPVEPYVDLYQVLCKFSEPEASSCHNPYSGFKDLGIFRASKSPVATRTASIPSRGTEICQLINPTGTGLGGLTTSNGMGRFKGNYGLPQPGYGCILQATMGIQFLLPQ